MKSSVISLCNEEFMICRIVILIEDQRRSDDENTATQSLLEATKLQCLELQV